MLGIRNIETFLATLRKVFRGLQLNEPGAEPALALAKFQGDKPCRSDFIAAKTNE
jgi:hypothetical protein